MMQNFSKIAVALDLTDGDDWVLNYLDFLVEQLAIVPEIHLFHNIKYPLDEELLGELNVPLTKIIEEEIADKVQLKLPKYAKNCTITITQEPSTIGALVAFVEQTKCGLTVFSKKLETEGSGVTTSRFIRQNKSNVLVVPSKYKSALSNICCPIDFSKNSFLAYQTAQQIHEQTKANFTPIHIYHVPKVYFPYIPVKPITKGNSERAVQQYKDFTKKYFKQTPQTNCEFIDGKNLSVVQNISTYCKAQSIDFMVVGTKGESSFIGSVALGLNEAPLKTPILFIKQ